MSRTFLAILAAAVIGCSQAPTRVHVDVDASMVTGLDHYQLRVGDRTALSDPLPALDVWLPDADAGKAMNIDVWGLADGKQVGYGASSMVPQLHGRIDAAVTLSPVSCGLLCTEGDVACAHAAGGDESLTCEQQTNGCLAWTATACPNAMPYCSNGTCGTTCSDECAAGQTDCASAVSMRTCETSTSGCLQWSDAMACATGEACTNDRCSTGVTCSHDGDSCDDGDDCTVHDTCNGGVCAGTPKTCTASPPMCASSTSLRTYTSSCMSGSCVETHTDQTCAHGCEYGVCRAWKAVSTFSGRGCALRADGSVACWGFGAIDEETGSYTAVSSGYRTACALASTGAIVCWGWGVPALTPPSGSFVALATGGDAVVCGIAATGTVTCSGSNAWGIENVPAGSYASIDLAPLQACGIRTNGTAVCWGGAGHPLAPPSGTFRAIDVGESHACGLRTNGTIVCFGDNSYGQIDAPSGTFIAVSSGFNTSCAIRTNGAIACWGENNVGQANMPLGTYSAVSSSGSFSCGIPTDGGMLVCWGDNSEFELEVPAL
jgi:hypothetical protein